MPPFWAVVFPDFLMRTLFIFLGIWLLINVLFVVVMIPPRKPRKRRRGPFTSAPLQTAPQLEDDRASLRHMIIAIALGVFFSLSPPLMEAYDRLSRWIRRKRGRNTDSEGRSSDESDGT